MKIIILMFSSLFFLMGCNVLNEVPTYQDPDTVEYTIETENNTIDEEARTAVQVIEDNLTYAQEENMEGYLSTIVSSAHEETEAELTPFFEEYDLNHTILSVEILEREEDIMLIRTEQQTVMVDSVEEAEPYRNHIAEANHTLVKENGEWKIEETIMTDTIFLEYDF